MAEEEKESEDWCFVCKDGGNLMLCDYKDCPKVYHAYCLEKDVSVSKNKEPLICEWHSCYLCSKRPKLYCLCCPHAVCEGCVTHAEFIHLKKDKGLCNQCQEYVFALEEIRVYSAAGDKIDLTDRNTFECLFLECWEIVKKQEGVTFEDVCASQSRQKGAKLRNKVGPKILQNGVHTSKSQKKGVKQKFKDGSSFSLSDHAVEDVGDSKMVGKRKKIEFSGWASKPLIDFLTSMGEDTREAMSQHSVESSIRRYIRRNNLLDREKKRVRCDKMLYSIFRKTSVNRKKIYRLLNAHLKENLGQLEHTTHFEHNLSEKNEKVLRPCKRQRKETSDEQTCENEAKPELQSAETFEKEVKPDMRSAETCENELKPEMQSDQTCEKEVKPDMRSAETCEKELKPEMVSAETCEKEPRPEMQSDQTCEKEVRPEMRSTGYATINAENINLVYLRKSLVLELLKRNENFGNKVVGSFVKLKNGPMDRIAYQILQVTGIETVNDQSEGVLLYLAGIATAVSISKLDDSDISKEEIEDLKQKVMNGLLRQPTVVEMEQKSKALHEDITKHWIARQLIVLQKRINFANEKGWRKQLDEYLEQREVLQKPSEQERLIRETPRIIEDLIEIKREATVSSSSDSSSKQVYINGLSQAAATDIEWIAK